ECHGCLGGVWTSGMLSFVIDAAKPGLNAEITAKLDALGAKMTDYRKSDDSHYVYDVEGMKYLLETLFDELKIDYVYHSRVVAVEKDSNNRVRAIVTE
ncbi:MAG TPA: FAD-dependent oxidoreductase, partial [Planctomycetaceae bacterium]|nr:FAD-dependent oxidoreductase [Planctomycetaceae bacterium]